MEGWRESTEQNQCLSAVPQSGIPPSCLPLQSTWRRGTFLLFFTSCQAVVWASDTLPVVLFLSFPRRGTPLLFLVYRILMILIIAIIINIIMIVTVNVVITGIIMMKTCFFLLLLFSLMLLLIR